jgi:ABC-type transport system involved in multi-copper enzyme maturation permease subunit
MLHSEARRGTLSLLLLTPLQPAGIVWGKWKAVMLHTATLACCGLPVLAVAVYLGGIGVEDLAWSLTLSLAMSGVGAAMSICYSVRDRTVVEAALRAFLMLQFSAIPYGFLVLVTAMGRSSHGLEIASWIHPTVAWWSAANPAESGEVARHGWIGAAACCVLFVRYYLGQAIPPLLLTREGSMFLEGPVQGGPLRHEESHEAAAPPPIWDAFPLLWKECATRTVRLPLAARSVLLVLFSLLTLVGFLNRPDGAIVQLWLLCPVALFLAIAIGAGHFAREKERRGFEMLLSAPISAGRVVGAKLLAGVLGAEVLILVLLITVGFATLMTGRTKSDVVLTTASFLLFTYVLASSLSLRSRTYRSAFMGAASVVVFILLGLPMILGLLESSPLTEAPAFLFAFHVLHPLMLVFTDRKFGYNELLLPAHLTLYGTATALLTVDMILRFRRLAEQR